MEPLPNVCEASYIKEIGGNSTARVNRLRQFARSAVGRGRAAVLTLVEVAEFDTFPGHGASWSGR